MTNPSPGTMVLLARFGTAEDAQLHAAELVAEGIPVQVLNAHVNSLGIPYAGLSDVELHVAAADQARATEVLKLEPVDDLEPDPEGGLAEPAVNENGQPATVIPLSGFATVRQLRDAQTLLASAGLPSYLPKLTPRGNHPPGIGPRFILRVTPHDLERGQFLLQQAEHDAAEEVPRCPKCGSWRVYPVSHVMQSLAATLGLAAKPTEELECLACRHRGTSTAFARHSTGGLQ